MDDDQLQPEHCAEMLKALSAPLRLRTIDLLRNGPRNVSEIAETLESELVNISHHLGILHEAGFVQRHKQGRQVVYSLSEGILVPAPAETGRQRLNLGCCSLEMPS